MLKKDTFFFIIVIVVGVSAISAGAWRFFAAPYFDEVNALRAIKTSCAEQISELQKKLTNLENQENKNIDNVLKEGVSNVANGATTSEKGLRSLRVISPNGGETVCVGEKLTIKIDVRDVEKMSLILVSYSGQSTESYNYIGNFPGLNESGEYGEWVIDWQVGDFKNQYSELDDDFRYKLRVENADGGSRVEDLSDKIFHIINCQG